jgi:hypothetical protein
MIGIVHQFELQAVPTEQPQPQQQLVLCEELAVRCETLLLLFVVTAVLLHCGRALGC